jgi:carbon storage regulator
MEDFRMLVLTRKLGEKILIGDDITITVSEIGKSRVKVGIEAPAGCQILRSELVAESEPRTTRSDADPVLVQTEVISRRHSPNRWATRTTEAVGA